LLRLEPPAKRRESKGHVSGLLRLERSQRDKSHRSGDRWDDKAHEVVGHSPSHHFTEWPWLSRVGSTQGIEVSGSLSDVDDCRRIPQSRKDQVRKETTAPPVSIDEGMDALKRGVCRSDLLQ
jgi:hypothetical protein